VCAHNAISVDAYDNELMVMGLKKALEFVEREKKLMRILFTGRIMERLRIVRVAGL
jgi:hypothetical protein